MAARAKAEVPVCYFSMGGWFYGMTTGMCTKNVFLRQAQYRMASEFWFAKRLATALTAAKIRNQRTLLLRNHIQPDPRTIARMKQLAEQAERAESLETLLGIEGTAARLYFGSFQGFVKTGYSLLVKDLSIACYTVGFDPMMGYYHQPRFSRPALALDLMEPFRPLIVDSVVLSAINNRMVTPEDFVSAGESINLTSSGRKAFYRAYELRMDGLVTHPLFDYRVSYRRLLEIQTRLLAKLLQGEISTYQPFVTR